MLKLYKAADANCTNYACHYLQNSATQRLSPDIADIGGNNEVLLYWVSPTERADAATVVFWSVNQCTLIMDISSCVGLYTSVADPGKRKRGLQNLKTAHAVRNFLEDAHVLTQ